MYDLDGARSALQMAATLSISDHELAEYQAKIATAIEARDNEIRMRYYGTTRLRYYDTTTNYSALTNIDSLRKITSDASSPYAYRRLLQRYLADDSSLTPAEMYFLIIGYSADPEYSPFNYSEISAIKMIYLFVEPRRIQLYRLLRLPPNRDTLYGELRRPNGRSDRHGEPKGERDRAYLLQCETDLHAGNREINYPPRNLSAP